MNIDLSLMKYLLNLVPFAHWVVPVVILLLAIRLTFPKLGLTLTLKAGNSEARGSKRTRKSKSEDKA